MKTIENLEAFWKALKRSTEEAKKKREAERKAKQRDMAGTGGRARRRKIDDEVDKAQR